MTTFVALLRAVNVGRGRSVPMAALRQLIVDNGGSDVRTLLQSGNAVFATARRITPAALEKQLEAAARARFGFDIAFLLRTLALWHRIIAHNPFTQAACDDPAHLLLMALKMAPAPAGVRALHEGYDGPETFAVRGDVAYFIYPHGVGRSKLTNTLIERRLGVAATARNWNTVLKLATLAAG
jgi:uncharacterized protein (DUF1697 family)